MVDVWWHYRVQSGFSVQPNWNIKAATHVTSSGYSHQLRSMEHVMCAQAQRMLTSPHPTNTREQMRSIQHVCAAKNVTVASPPPTIKPMSWVAWGMCVEVQATSTSSPHPTQPITFMWTYSCSWDTYTQATANVASAPRRVCLMYSTGSGKMKTKSVTCVCGATANVEPCRNNYSELLAPNHAKG